MDSSWWSLLFHLSYLKDIDECEYGSEDLSDMVYRVKLVFNQRLLCTYDSRLGKYVGYDEYGIINAEHYNNQSWKMRERKAELDSLCRAHARYYINSTRRKVPPDVTVRSNEKARYGQLTTLECHVYNFYPRAINVTWLIDGSKVNEDVTSTEFMDNGDWSYQIHSYLELVVQRGVRVSCQVEHSSLKEPLIVNWDSTPLDSRIMKLTVGCTLFIIGLIVTFSSVYYYYKRKHRGFTSLPLHGHSRYCTSLHCTVMAAPIRLISRLTLVTGGGSGIGRAVCQRFATEGASVVVADRNEESANQTLQLLSRDHKGQEHMALGVDVSLKDSVENLVSSIQLRYFQPPSVCVNAAGITQDEFLLKMEEQDFDRVIGVNLKGTFLVTQAVSKALVSAGAQKGSIITVGSIVGKVGNIGQVNYSASKAGVEGLTRTAAKELSKFGIRCNCVLPGFITTPMTDKVPEKVISKLTSSIPMGRMGEPAEVADACAFLASDDSRYITGISIEVAGGLFIG
ncbi:(3R)-3-hydroxyacyl-CoA dehydrogenase isoform X2 [Misgurnus anguillicaudatus]|uniref:(3R)-3-hydroxyacyl-CoA dehydrogenase isoform X2 n=1 Tax=Misgurnus anguillicaudatus TaxID=75329 RepID=UPI003CCF84F9